MELLDLTILLPNIILLAIGFLIGFGTAKVLKGILLIVVAIIIVAIVGMTIVSFTTPAIEDLMKVAEPFKDFGRWLLSMLYHYPMFAVGLILGFIIGLVK